MSLPHAFLFTDGSASHNEDVGAWAAVAITTNGDQKKVLYGIAQPSTISRCELMPIVEGLRWIKGNWYTAGHTGMYNVVVVSDSEYTVRTASGEYGRKKNVELWAALDAASKTMDVRYLWRERNTNYYTEICDALCGGIRRLILDGLKDKGFPDPRKIETELKTVDLNYLVEGT